MKHSLLFCLVLLTATLQGCGPASDPTGTLSGTLTVDGKTYDKPVDLIALNPKTGKGSSTTVNKDGSFTFDKPLFVGEYTIYLAPAAPPESSEKAVSVTIDNSIPDQYWNETSTIKVSVKEGKNEGQKIEVKR